MALSSGVIAMLREHMHDESINIMFEDSKDITPILAAAEMRSMEEGFGRQYVVPVQYGTGFNASFGDTVPTAVVSDRTRWTVDPVVINTSASWTRDDIDAAKGDGEKFDIISAETDLKTIHLRNLIAQQLTGRGYGSLGTVLAVNASPAYFDTQADRINRYVPGMTLVTCDDEATSTLDGTALTVTGTDPDLGRVFVNSSPAGASWDVGDHVFISGSRQNSATPAKLVLTGLLGWVDSTAPSGATGPSPASIFGVDRSNRWELSGHRINASTAGLDHEGALIRGANRLKQIAGVRADTCFVSNADWEILCADKSAVKTLQITNANKYQVSFSGIELLTDGGTMKVIADAYVPQGTAWMGPFQDRKYAPFIGYSGGSLVNIDDKDGLPFRRKVDGTVGYEMLLYARLQYIVPAPGKFLVCSGLPST